MLDVSSQKNLLLRRHISRIGVQIYVESCTLPRTVCYRVSFSLTIRHRQLKYPIGQKQYSLTLLPLRLTCNVGRHNGDGPVLEVQVVTS